MLGANDELTIMFPIEGVRTSRLMLGTAQASPLSLGFWIQGHRAGTYSGSIMNAGKTRAYPFSFTIAADTPTWIPFSHATTNEIVADTAGTWLNSAGVVGLYISICLAGGTSRVGAAGAWGSPASPGLVGVTGTTNGVAATSDVFNISNVIALPGLELPSSAAAPLTVRPFDYELTETLRYYQKSFNYGTAPVQAGGLTAANIVVPPLPTSAGAGSMHILGFWH